MPFRKRIIKNDFRFYLGEFTQPRPKPPRRRRGDGRTHPSMLDITDGRIWDAPYDDAGRRIIFRPQDRFTNKQRERADRAKNEAREKTLLETRLGEIAYLEDVWSSQEGG